MIKFKNKKLQNKMNPKVEESGIVVIGPIILIAVLSYLLYKGYFMHIAISWYPIGLIFTLAVFRIEYLRTGKCYIRWTDFISYPLCGYINIFIFLNSLIDYRGKLK